MGDNRAVHSRVTQLCLTVLATSCLLSGCRVSDATPTPPADSPRPDPATPTLAASPTLPATPTSAPPTTATASPSSAVSPSPDVSASPTASPSDPGAPTVDPNAGLSWQLADAGVFTSMDVISDAVALGSLVVAVGTTETQDVVGAAGAWYSLDGQTWQPADDLPDAEYAAIDAVSAGPGGLVGVGFDDSGDTSVPAVWRTTDGRSWTRVDDADLDRGQMAAVAGGADGYVAIGSDFDDGTSLVWTSSDGADWSAGEPVPGVDSGAAINGLAAIGQGFIAYGSSADGNARMWYSPDGREWQVAEGFGDEADSAVNDVAVSDDGFVAVGARYLGDTTRALVWTSSDGLTWQAVPGLELDGEMIGVEPVGPGFYAVGAMPETNELIFNAAVWASPDGVAWQRRPDDASFELARMIEVFQAGPGLVVIGDKSLDAAGEELAPAVWVGVPQ